MRTGLLAAGVAVAVVGAGLLVALFFLPGLPTDTRYSSVTASDIGPGGGTKSWELAEDATSSGTLALAWNASAPVQVSLYPSVPCQGQGSCPASPPLVTWYANSTGTFSYHGAIGSAYFVSVVNFGQGTVSFVGTLTETYTVSTPSQAVPAWALIMIGGVFLLGIGGIAIFLGLFLPSGIYRPPRSGLDAFDPDNVDARARDGPDPPEPGEA